MTEPGSPLAAYAKARAADSLGSAGDAARSYATALAHSPGNEILAARALGQALAAGDRPLAVRSARILEQGGVLAPDARLLLLSEALRTRDWNTARAHIDRIEKDQIFAFMAPVLRAWTAYGAKSGDPIAILDAAADDPMAGAYAAEHRPMLLLALGREREALAAIGTAAEGGGRAHRLRIAAASLLAKRGRRAEALTLLQGEEAPIAAARRLVEKRKPVPAPIDSAAAGVAEFLVRIAIDLHRQNVDRLALTYARLATFLAPESSETWLVTSELLAGADQHDEALAVLRNVAADDPFAAGIADLRVRLLVDAGRQVQALAAAEASTRAGSTDAADWTRLGDLYAELDRHDEAVKAYDRALGLAGAGDAQPLWALHLLRGGALHEAERWPEAEAALREAYRLAPDQPVVLNYLGYAQLERRENLEEAERLIREASRLQPDDAAITDSLGWAHYVRGNVRQAIELLEKAVAGQPADPAINEHLGDAYYSAGRRFEARYAWEAALLHAEDKAAERLRAKIDAGLKPELASP